MSSVAHLAMGLVASLIFVVAPLFLLWGKRPDHVVAAVVTAGALASYLISFALVPGEVAVGLIVAGTGMLAYLVRPAQRGYAAERDEVEGSWKPALRRLAQERNEIRLAMSQLNASVGQKLAEVQWAVSELTTRLDVLEKSQSAALVTPALMNAARARQASQKLASGETSQWSSSSLQMDLTLLSLARRQKLSSAEAAQRFLSLDEEIKK